MGGLIIVAIIVIVCYFMWRKNQNKNTPTEKKSIESKEKASGEKLHKAEDLKNLDDSVKTSKAEKDLKIDENSANAFEVKEEQKYDGSRKKDRGKKRREKRKLEAEEEKKAPAAKIDDKKVEAKAEKVEPKVEKVEAKPEAKKESVKPAEKSEVKTEKAPEKTQAKAEKVEKPVEKAEVKAEKPVEKTEAKAEKIEPKKEEAKAKVNEPAKKVEPKVDKVQAKPEAKKESIKPAEKAEVITEKPAEKVEAKAEKPIEKTEAKAEKVEKPVEKIEPKIKEAKAKVNEPVKKVEPKVEKVEPKVEKVEAKPEAKEKIDNPVEKSQAQKIISTNEKYSHIIKALGENPWELASEKINIKLEDLKTKKPLDENYSLDDIKKSLTRENLSEFLNMVKTNPTILKRKDKVTYEFTIKNPDEIKKIAERYSLSSSNFEKASSLLTVDKENAKLLEVTDILTEGEKRIYIETKF